MIDEGIKGQNRKIITNNCAKKYQGHKDSQTDKIQIFKSDKDIDEDKKQ